MIVSEIEVMAKAPGEPSPLWAASTTYRAGDEVFHDGAHYRAVWRTQQEPGTSARGAWQEIVRSGDGTAVWTASRIFKSRDVVVHDGDKYRATRITRGEEPGGRHGPWRLIGS